MPEFARNVVAVRHDDHGDPIWVLADGRLIVRAVDHHAGEAPFVLLRPNGDADPAHLTTR